MTPPPVEKGRHRRRPPAVLLVVFVVLGAVLTAGPLTWVLMLALGNFGLAQYGFVDCLPASLFVAMSFGAAKAEIKK